MIEQKKEGKVESLRNLVLFEDYSEDQKNSAEEAGL